MAPGKNGGTGQARVRRPRATLTEVLLEVEELQQRRVCKVPPLGHQRLHAGDELVLHVEVGGLRLAELFGVARELSAVLRRARLHLGDLAHQHEPSACELSGARLFIQGCTATHGVAGLNNRAAHLALVVVKVHQPLLPLVVQLLDALDLAEVGGDGLEHLGGELDLERALRAALKLLPHARALRRRLPADGVGLADVVARAEGMEKGQKARRRGGGEEEARRRREMTSHLM